jgi:hypothetical protein
MEYNTSVRKPPSLMLMDVEKPMWKNTLLTEMGIGGKLSTMVALSHEEAELPTLITEDDEVENVN